MDITAQYTKHYELTDWLGNVRVVITNKKIPLQSAPLRYRPDVVSVTDYYAFGSEVRERTYEKANYEFGFNGQEKDDEVSGNGNSLDFGERIYDSRLGRFLSVDKLTGSYPWWSPFAFAGNTPIQAIDFDGLEIYYAQSGQKIGTYGTSTEIRVLNEDQVSTATTEFATYSNALKTDPAATNTYLGNGAVTGSVAFADYFTTVADVTNDAALETYANNGKNCYTAARKQCTNEGVTPSGPGDAINTSVVTADNLTENKIGGAIYIQTQLNAGNPVMVGVKETKTDGTVPDPGNTNSLTGHFVAIRSTNVASDGTVTFNYLDNAKASTGKSSNNNFTLDISSGSLIDNTTPGGRTNYSSYEITEVRTNP